MCGADVGTDGVQPSSSCLQHQACLSRDQCFVQVDRPTLQSKATRALSAAGTISAAIGHPRSVRKQHQTFFSCDQSISHLDQPTEQLIVEVEDPAMAGALVDDLVCSGKLHRSGAKLQHQASSSFDQFWIKLESPALHLAGLGVVATVVGALADEGNDDLVCSGKLHRSGAKLQHQASSSFDQFWIKLASPALHLAEIGVVLRRAVVVRVTVVRSGVK